MKMNNLHNMKKLPYELKNIIFEEHKIEEKN